MAEAAPVTDGAASNPAEERFSAGMCGLGRCIAMTNLKACSGCNMVFYCCKDHQVEHFKKEGHKIVCKGRKEGQAPAFNELAASAQKYMKSKSFRMALMNFGAMLELTEQALDNTYHPQCANILDQMAICYKELSEIPNAINAYSRVLMIRDFNNESNDPVKCAEAYRTMGQWAECFLLIGQAGLARDAFKKIEQTALEYFGEQSCQRGQAFLSLGSAYIELNQCPKAEVSFKLALSLDHFGKSSEPSNMLLASRCHYNYGLMLSALGRHTDAATQFSACIDKKTRAGITSDDHVLKEARICLASAEKGVIAPNAPEFSAKASMAAATLAESSSL